MKRIRGGLFGPTIRAGLNRKRRPVAAPEPTRDLPERSRQRQLGSTRSAVVEAFVGDQGKRRVQEGCPPMEGSGYLSLWPVPDPFPSPQLLQIESIVHPKP